MTQMAPEIQPVTLEELRAVVVAQQEQMTALSMENSALKARVAELERRLGLNSTNSSQPPGSEGLSKPSRSRPPRSLREVSGKKPGAQAGHEGKTLRAVPHPDHFVDHYPEHCSRCGATLDATASRGYRKRQVFALPKPPPLQVTEHRAHRCACPSCGESTAAAFPEGVTALAQYGANLTARVVYLHAQHHIPEDRVVEILHDVMGVDLAAGTVGAMVTRQAGTLAEVADAIGEHVKQASVKHLDETGCRIGGKTLWLHVASTLLLTLYRVSPQRGDLLSGVIGTVIHDCWKPYFTLSGVLHGLCNAHLLRELKALMEFEKEPWAFAMFRLLRRACHLVNLARARGIELKPRSIQALFARYDRLVAQGLAFHEAQPPPEGSSALTSRRRRGRPRRRIGHNLLIRLRDHRDAVLRFLINPAVPFTNNLAEQDLRMMKLRQKISGGFRSRSGAEAFAILRTVLSTARKQGWDILDTLTQPPAALVLKLRTA